MATSWSCQIVYQGFSNVPMFCLSSACSVFCPCLPFQISLPTSLCFFGLCQIWLLTCCRHLQQAITDSPDLLQPQVMHLHVFVGLERPINSNYTTLRLARHCMDSAWFYTRFCPAWLILQSARLVLVCCAVWAGSWCLINHLIDPAPGR